MHTEQTHAEGRLLMAQMKVEEALSRPLPPGTVIVYADMQATVVFDSGRGSLEVNCEGIRQRWLWALDGETCRVVQLALKH